MSVEVREIAIRAVVDDQTKNEMAAKQPPEKKSEEIIDECVERVLEILKREKER